MLEIRDSVFVINEEQSLVSIHINSNKTKLPAWDNQDLVFKVYFKEKRMTVSSTLETVEFRLLTDNILYYLHKTDKLMIFTGVYKQKVFKPKKIYECLPSFEID